MSHRSQNVHLGDRKSGATPVYDRKSDVSHRSQNVHSGDRKSWATAVYDRKSDVSHRSQNVHSGDRKSGATPLLKTILNEFAMPEKISTRAVRNSGALDGRGSNTNKPGDDILEHMGEQDRRDYDNTVKEIADKLDHLQNVLLKKRAGGAGGRRETLRVEKQNSNTGVKSSGRSIYSTSLMEDLEAISSDSDQEEPGKSELAKKSECSGTSDREDLGTKTHTVKQPTLQTQHSMQMPVKKTTSDKKATKMSSVKSQKLQHSKQIPVEKTTSDKKATKMSPAKSQKLQSRMAFVKKIATAIMKQPTSDISASGNQGLSMSSNEPFLEKKPLVVLERNTIAEQLACKLVNKSESAVTLESIEEMQITMDHVEESLLDQSMAEVKEDDAGPSDIKLTEPLEMESVEESLLEQEPADKLVVACLWESESLELVVDEDTVEEPSMEPALLEEPSEVSENQVVAEKNETAHEQHQENEKETDEPQSSSLDGKLRHSSPSGKDPPGEHRSSTDDLFSCGITYDKFEEDNSPRDQERSRDPDSDSLHIDEKDRDRYGDSLHIDEKDRDRRGDSLHRDEKDHLDRSDEYKDRDIERDPSHQDQITDHYDRDRYEGRDHLGYHDESRSENRKRSYPDDHANDGLDHSDKDQYDQHNPRKQSRVSENTQSRGCDGHTSSYMSDDEDMREQLKVMGNKN